MLKRWGSVCAVALAAGAAPLARGVIVNSSGQVTASGSDLAAYLGAGAFYNAGYTGSRATIANIEGGMPWAGHQSLGHVRAMPLMAGAVPTVMNHATGVTAVFGARGHRTLDVGIATGSTILAGSIATSTSANGNFTYTAATAAGTYLEAAAGYAADGSTRARADVINGSWGILGGYVGTSGLVNDIDGIISQTGTLVVAAAGNSGPGDNSVAVPAVALNVMAVGSLGSSGPAELHPDYNAPSAFSSRSPSNILLPGWATARLRAAISIAAPGEGYSVAGYNGPGTVPNWYYFNCRGTSYAAPAVSGGAALLADVGYDRFVTGEDRSAIDGRTLRAVLMNSADKTEGWDNGQQVVGDGLIETTRALDYTVGAGRMDLGRAFNQYTAGATGHVALDGDGTGSVPDVGWNAATASPDAVSQTYELAPMEAAGETLAATLTWFADASYAAADNAGTLNALADFSLEVDEINADSTLTRIAISDARYGTAEHLFITLPGDGRYAVRVNYEGADYGPAEATGYAVAWSVQVPEAGVMPALGLPLLGLGRRRRAIGA